MSSFASCNSTSFTLFKRVTAFRFMIIYKAHLFLIFKKYCFPKAVFECFKSFCFCHSHFENLLSLYCRAFSKTSFYFSLLQGLYVNLHCCLAHSYLALFYKGKHHILFSHFLLNAISVLSFSSENLLQIASWSFQRLWSSNS